MEWRSVYIGEMPKELLMLHPNNQSFGQPDYFPQLSGQPEDQMLVENVKHGLKIRPDLEVCFIWSHSKDEMGTAFSFIQNSLKEPEVFTKRLNETLELLKKNNSHFQEFLSLDFLLDSLIVEKISHDDFSAIIDRYLRMGQSIDKFPDEFEWSIVINKMFQFPGQLFIKKILLMKLFQVKIIKSNLESKDIILEFTKALVDALNDLFEQMNLKYEQLSKDILSIFNQWKDLTLFLKDLESSYLIDQPLYLESLIQIFKECSLVQLTFIMPLFNNLSFRQNFLYSNIFAESSINKLKELIKIKNSNTANVLLIENQNQIIQKYLQKLFREQPDLFIQIFIQYEPDLIELNLLTKDEIGERIENFHLLLTYEKVFGSSLFRSIQMLDHLSLNADIKEVAEIWFLSHLETFDLVEDMIKSVQNLLKWTLSDIKTYKIYLATSLLFKFVNEVVVYDLDELEISVETKKSLLEISFQSFIDENIIKFTDIELETISRILGRLSKLKIFSLHRYLNHFISNGYSFPDSFQSNDSLTDLESGEENQTIVKMKLLFKSIPVFEESRDFLNQRRVTLYGLNGDETQLEQYTYYQNIISHIEPYFNSDCNIIPQKEIKVDKLNPYWQQKLSNWILQQAAELVDKKIREEQIKLWINLLIQLSDFPSLFDLLILLLKEKKYDHLALNYLRLYDYMIYYLDIKETINEALNDRQLTHVFFEEAKEKQLSLSNGKLNDGDCSNETLGNDNFNYDTKERLLICLNHLDFFNFKNQSIEIFKIVSKNGNLLPTLQEQLFIFFLVEQNSNMEDDKKANMQEMAIEIIKRSNEQFQVELFQMILSRLEASQKDIVNAYDLNALLVLCSVLCQNINPSLSLAIIFSYLKPTNEIFSTPNTKTESTFENLVWLSFLLECLLSVLIFNKSIDAEEARLFEMVQLLKQRLKLLKDQNLVQKLKQQISLASGLLLKSIYSRTKQFSFLKEIMPTVTSGSSEESLIKSSESIDNDIMESNYKMNPFLELLQLQKRSNISFPYND